MGLLSRLKEWLEEPYSYKSVAEDSVGYVRQTVRSVHGNDLEVTRPLEANRLKKIISSAANKGGKTQYKKALAIWQHGKALYPEWITDVDKPTLVPEYWKDPRIPDTSD